MNKFILSIDQGTTGSRAFVFDARGRVIASAYQEFKQYYPKPGWVEHDADEIWKSVEAVIRKAVAESRIDPKSIAGIGITNQRETTVVWDRRTSKPFHRAIVWQCRRTAEACAKLKKHESLFRKITGLVVDAYFSGTKIQWLLDHVPGLRRRAIDGQVAVGTIDTWIIYKLTNGAQHVTDMTNASRTLIFDIRKKSWSKPILKILNIPENILPKVLPSASVFGYTAKGMGGLPEGIPISAVMGDQQSALFGQGCFTPGTIKNTYGTGCFMLLNTGSKCVYSHKGLLTTLGCNAAGEPVYVLEGAVFIAGAVIQWLRDELKIIKDSSSSEEIAKGIKDTEGVYFVPAFVGLGAPYWNPQARGIITGLTRGTNTNHIVRAALESMVYQTKEVFDLMSKESGIKIKSLAVDGGACRNDFLMQFQADMLSIPVVRPLMVDTTVAGAAYLAGVSIGLWTLQDVLKIKKIGRIFKPVMPRQEVQRRFNGWTHAVRQAVTQ